MNVTKTKKEATTDGFYDLMYSTKTINEVLSEVYEYGFANGFKQGNDNAREVAEFEKKKSCCGNKYPNGEPNSK